MVTPAAFSSASIYWRLAVTLLFLFLPGVSNHANVPGRAIWLFIAVYFATGAIGVECLAFYEEVLIR